MSSHVICHVCQQEVVKSNNAHRGLLINSRARLSSSLITNREKLNALKKKRWSKQYAKQRELDLIAISKLEEAVKNDEELLTSITLMMEVYDG